MYQIKARRMAGFYFYPPYAFAMLFLLLLVPPASGFLASYWQLFALYEMGLTLLGCRLLPQLY